MQENKNYLTAGDLIRQANADFIQYIKNGKYKDLLLSMSNLNCYSITNQILIHSQNPNAKCVNNLKVWNYNHRNVKKGETAIQIIAPNKEKTQIENSNENTQDSEVFSYKVSNVFDISQTDGKDFYDLEFTKENTLQNFETIKEALERLPRDFEIKFMPIDDVIDGYCDFSNKCLIIKEGMSFEKTLKSLIYQVGHALNNSRIRNNFNGLTSKELKNIKRIENESIAFVVANRLGLESSLSYSKELESLDDESILKFKKNLDIIRSVSYQMLSGIEPSLQKQIKEQLFKRNMKKGEEELC